MEFETIALPDGCAPETICLECAAGALFHRGTETLILHCSHSLTGAALPLGREWLTVRGVELHVFRELVARAIVKAELTRDVERELAVLIAQQPGTRH